MKKFIPLVVLCMVLLTVNTTSYAQKKLSDLTTTGLNPQDDPIVVGGTTYITGTIENAWNGFVSANATLITLQLAPNKGVWFNGLPHIVKGLGTGYIDTIAYTVVSNFQTTNAKQIITIRITDVFPAFESIVFAYPVIGKAVNVGTTENIAFKVEYDATQPGNDSDNDGTNNNITSTLTVTQPVINPDINATFVNVPVSGNVHTNDLVKNGTVYSSPVLLPGSPAGANAMISMNPDGTYTFSSDKVGVYVYNVTNCPPTGSCYTSLLTITVSDKVITLVAPVANTDIASTLSANPVTLHTLANDNSMNLNYQFVTSSVSVISAPKNGTTQVDPLTGDITYTPADNFVGNDTLFYKVCTTNPISSCATAMQIITVLPSTAPNSVLAADDFSKTDVGVPANGNALTNDTDPEEEGLVATAQNNISIPGAGTYSIDEEGNYTFTPLPKFTGATNFVYQVCDVHAPVSACTNATVYIIVTPAGGALAIGFQSFNAKWSGDWASITWKGSGNETPGAYYQVERSVNGVNYIAIGKVNAVTGLGNYSYTDKDVASSVLSNTTTFYYRLKMVDIDGTSKYSNIENLNRTGVDNSIRLYPNPTSGIVHFTNLQNVKAIELRSSVGQLIQSIENVQQQGLNYNFNVRSSGSYIVVLRMENGQRSSLPLTIAR